MAMNREWTYCDGEGGLESSAAMTRRAAMAAGAVGLLGLLGVRKAWAQTSFQNGATHDNVLVVIFLRGGMDGLNMVVPHGEDDYYRLRPTLGIATPGKGGGVNKLDDFFGLHPSMPDLHQLYQDGKAGFVHAIGSGDQTRSHFEAMAAMEQGVGSPLESAGGGWLGRHITSTPGRTSPLRAVALSSVMPDSLGGALGALAVESMAQFKLATEDEAAIKALESMYGAGGDPIREAGKDTLRVLDALRKVDPKDYKPDGGAAYPETPFANALREVAFLIKQDLGLEIAALDMGGWDTHIAQGGAQGWQAGLLGEVSGALGAFAKDMGGEMSRITVVVQTEFGRRAAENSGFGTDHGRASVMTLLGAGVNGGKVHGRWPGLKQADLEGPGDLRVTTDYRNVLAEVLANRLHNKRLDQVFPGHRVAPMGVVA
jgi:uncharacterized protein (DUF1501 family)